MILVELCISEITARKVWFNIVTTMGINDAWSFLLLFLVFERGYDKAFHRCCFRIDR